MRTIVDKPDRTFMSAFLRITGLWHALRVAALVESATIVAIETIVVYTVAATATAALVFKWV